MTLPPPIHTTRLTLIPSTAPLASASITDRRLFSTLLNAHIPDQWPPETLADVEPLFAQKLAENPLLAGWWGWYILATDPTLIPAHLNASQALVGSIGCTPPDPDGITFMGYSVLPAFEHRGIATEAAVAMTAWILAQPAIRTIHAETFEQHHASRRILDRCGFALSGPSPNDATAAESDRQGRGTLLRYAKTPSR